MTYPQQLKTCIKRVVIWIYSGIPTQGVLGKGLAKEKWYKM